MIRKLLVAFFVIAGVIVVWTSRADAEAGPGDRGQEVVEVQYLLRSYGYVLKVDGVYGPQTTKAVKLWQKANGLLQDGIVGPITMESLVNGQRQAVRVGNPAGLRGMAFAPEGLTGCDEVEWYARQAGLPETVVTVEGQVITWGQLAYREAGCKNSVGNACCHGWFGLHAGNIENHWSYEPFVKQHCQVFTVSDYRGDLPLQKQKSACFAKVLYDISGMKPWRL